MKAIHFILSQTVCLVLLPVLISLTTSCSNDEDLQILRLTDLNMEEVHVCVTIQNAVGAYVLNEASAEFEALGTPDSACLILRGLHPLEPMAINLSAEYELGGTISFKGTAHGSRRLIEVSGAYKPSNFEDVPWGATPWLFIDVVDFGIPYDTGFQNQSCRLDFSQGGGFRFNDNYSTARAGIHLTDEQKDSCSHACSKINDTLAQSLEFADMRFQGNGKAYISSNHLPYASVFWSREAEEEVGVMVDIEHPYFFYKGLICILSPQGFSSEDYDDWCGNLYTGTAWIYPCNNLDYPNGVAVRLQDDRHYEVFGWILRHIAMGDDWTQYDRDCLELLHRVAKENFDIGYYGTWHFARSTFRLPLP